ncbi:hypothetical protein FPSE5266_20248 [Fusarium pseudograminearum]|nr:hypothetical protein FPSE5266_20248 [Fusarium pseudograminearum]
MDKDLGTHLDELVMEEADQPRRPKLGLLQAQVAVIDQIEEVKTAIKNRLEHIAQLFTNIDEDTRETEEELQKTMAVANAHSAAVGRLTDYHQKNSKHVDDCQRMFESVVPSNLQHIHKEYTAVAKDMIEQNKEQRSKEREVSESLTKSIKELRIKADLVAQHKSGICATEKEFWDKVLHLVNQSPEHGEPLGGILDETMETKI